MKIRIKHRPQNELFGWILLCGPFLIAPLMQFLGFPGSVKYILDAVWLLLLLTMVFKNKRHISSSARFLLRLVLVFFLFTVVNYVVNFQSPLYYLWGFRNNFRGYILFFAVIYYFNEKSVEDALSFLDKIFYINAALMIFQFFVLGYKQDFLGGIFGVEQGCNSYTNIFFCIMTVINYIRYCNGEQRLYKTTLSIFLMLALSAMAELKFFYVEFVILMIAGTLVTRFSWKKLGIILAGFVAFIIGYNIFVSVFPDINLTFNELMQYATSEKGYTASGDLNRLNFISTVNSGLLPTLRKQILGLGLGNCDYAAGIDALTTPFSRQYGWTHYGWMSTTFMYLENGLVGIIFFFGFFVSIFISSLMMRKTGNVNSMYCQIAALCAIAAIMNGFYNISLRIESGYMMYFILAIPWCSSCNSQLQEEEYES